MNARLALVGAALALTVSAPSMAFAMPQRSSSALAPAATTVHEQVADWRRPDPRNHRHSPPPREERRGRDRDSDREYRPPVMYVPAPMPPVYWAPPPVLVYPGFQFYLRLGALLPGPERASDAGTLG